MTRSSLYRSSVLLLISQLALLTIGVASAFTALPSPLAGSLRHPASASFYTNSIKKAPAFTSRSSSSSALFYIQEPTEETANNNEGVFQSPNSGAPGKDEASVPAAFFSGASQNPDFKLALDDLLNQQQNSRNLSDTGNGKATSKDVNQLVFLFVGQYHAEQFEAIVEYAQTKLEDDSIPTKNVHKSTQQHVKSKNGGMEVVVMLGGGVIGGGDELDNSQTPAVTMLSGRLPEKSFTVFQNEAGDEDSELPEGILADIEKDASSAMLDATTQTTAASSRPPSYMVFSDPFAPLDALLHRLDEPSYHDPAIAPPVVAGGVTVPHRQQRVPSIARNGSILPAGSLVGIAFTGNVGLMAIVAQGCRPVGPTFVITEASNTILTGLSGKSAIEQLEQVAEDADEEDKELIRNGEFVCGIGTTNSAVVDIAEHVFAESNDSNHAGEADNKETMMVNDEDEGASDFLIRQIKGYQPKRGSIVVAAGGLKEGSTFRFHVRAAKSAQEDMELMIQRAKTERLFAGSSTLFKTGPGALSVAKGKPLAAFQLSCVARGSGFYGSPNVDLEKVEGLFSDNESNPNTKPAIAGFFANGEIGPVGIRMAEMAAKNAEQQNDRTSSNTFLHGFTTVVAMLCDYSDTNTSTPAEKVSTDGIMDSSHDAWA